MNKLLQALRSERVGLALSGGSVRGIAHIGVLKALTEAGIRPSIITGTSAGSLVGAAFAAGMDWKQIADMAREVFWPGLLNRAGIERHCRRYLPERFEDLALPFAALATAVPSKRPIVLSSGDLAAAISASCALRVIRRSVSVGGQRLKDGGTACVLPSRTCREHGAELVIASDVWELSAVLRGLGLHPQPHGRRQVYPSHYLEALRLTDLLVQPDIPKSGYVPGVKAVERLIEAGERATIEALEATAKRAAA